MTTAIEYVRFELLQRPADRKTDVWYVAPLSGGSVLGSVKFYGAWRKYVFFPREETLYDANCLRAIADFCERQTVALKEVWRTRA